MVGWNIDHSLDDPPSKKRGSVSTVSDKSSVIVDPVVSPDELETPEMKKARKRSLWVAYVTMFVMSIGFSIVLSGVWPYLKNIDPNMTKEGLGWVVAANPFGQMLASPLLGIWGNKAGSIRPACLATIACFIFGNALYSCLYGISDPNTAYYIMIFARFVVGVSSANVTLCRSYVAGATTQEERTTGISIIAAAQALGFVVGPVIQAILTVTVKGTTGSGAFTWDKYTSAGWVAAVFGLVNLVVMLPCVFQEHYIAEKEQAMLRDEPTITRQMDYTTLSVLLYAFFLPVLVLVFLETIGVPFVTDQYGWDSDTAMFNAGLFLSFGGLCMMSLFYSSGIIVKKVDERIVMIFMGAVPLTIGCFVFLPFQGSQIEMSNCTESQSQGAGVEVSSYIINSSHNTPLNLLNWKLAGERDFSFLLEPSELNYDSEITSTLDCTLGCPQNQIWCHYVPQLGLAQLVVACMFVMGGFPMLQSVTLGLYSKVVEGKNQGVWMSLLGIVGSIARISGPVCVSYVYTEYGTYWTFGILTLLMVTLLIVLASSSNRLGKL